MTRNVTMCLCSSVYDPSCYIWAHLVSPKFTCKCMNENLVRQDVYDLATQYSSMKVSVFLVKLGGV